jgi:hypothetical protein
MKKIKFIAKDRLTEEIIDPPKPAQKNLPDWYKKLPIYTDNNIKFHLNYFLQNNLTSKNCIPVFDSISAGYILEFPCDVHFVDKDSNIKNHTVLWDVDWEVISSHSEDQVGDIGIPDNFDKNAWKLRGNWRIQTPKGYSILYTHPFYRYDLPFISATGIVDSDIYDTEMNIPFFLKKDFTGTIKKGTPIAQIIPIKRDVWKHTIEKHEENHIFSKNKIKRISRGSYKKLFWQKKKYL